MVKNITTEKSGLRDWKLQRISALVLAAYSIFLIVYLLSHTGITFMDWKHLFSQIWMRIFNTLMLLSLIIHAWIGAWTVITDYLKPKFVRLTAQIILFLVLLVFFILGIIIFWGV